MVFNLLKANNGNKIEAFNELEDIYDSMSRKNRTEIARKIIELSFRHSALIDICVRNGKGKLGNYLWFLLFLNLLPYKNNGSFGNTWGFKLKPLLTNPGKLIQILFQDFSFPGGDSNRFLENSSVQIL